MWGAEEKQEPNETWTHHESHLDPAEAAVASAEALRRSVARRGVVQQIVSDTQKLQGSRRRGSVQDMLIDMRTNPQRTRTNPQGTSRRMSTDDMFQALTLLEKRETTIDPLRQKKIDEEESECQLHERATHNMNYHLLLIFHSDVDMRPCRPILRVVHLCKTPGVLAVDIDANKPPEILTTCQLGDQSMNSAHEFVVDPRKLLCVYALSITDSEAAVVINNVAKINTDIVKNRTALTQRSNLAFFPMFLQRGVRSGMRSMYHLCKASSVTDVQICIITMRESLNHARSINAKLRTLHPYLATSENFHNAIETFTRPLDVYCFKRGVFKYALP